MDNPQFVVGHGYTREEIRNVLGGDKVSNFPKQNGRVVCCCVARYTHPDAPEIILVNRSIQMIPSARQIASQLEAIPVFVFDRYREDPKVYRGMFVGVGYTEDRAEIIQLAMRVWRQDVKALLYLKRVGD